MKKLSLFLVAGTAAVLGLVTMLPADAAFDADAAQALFKKNECAKCHSVDKTKTGPALKKIALKYKDKLDAQDRVIKQITTAPKMKTEDGSDEEHKVINTKDPVALKNLADWILSQ